MHRIALGVAVLALIGPALNVTAAEQSRAVIKQGGPGWKYSPVLGCVNVKEYPWVYHEDGYWFYCGSDPRAMRGNESYVMTPGSGMSGARPTALGDPAE